MTQDQELKLMKQLYDRIYDMMTQGSGGRDGGFSAKTSMFQMVPVGIPINPQDYAKQLSPVNPNGDLNTAEFFSKLVDPVPRPQSLYIRGADGIEKTYGNIINNANTTQQPDEKALEIYNKAKQFLTTETEVTDFMGNKTTQIQNTAIYTEYITNRSSYITALAGYRNAFNNFDLTDPKQQREWQASEPMLMNNLNNSYNKWRSNGATQVEQALSAMETSINNAVSSILSNDKTNFVNSTLASSTGAGAEWHLSYPMPSTWYDEKSPIFTTIEINSEREFLKEDSKFEKYGASASFSYGIWSAGGDFEQASKETHKHTEAEHLKISFDAALVSIVRPWFDASIFKFGGWTNNAYPAGSISSGNFDDVNAALPMVPTAFLVAKNITVEGDFKVTDDEMIEKSMSAGFDVGIGCFKASGHYSSGNSEHTFSSKMEDGKLTIPGMQIIGFLSEVLPLSPKQ